MFATAGNDSIIAFWDFEDLLCSGTVTSNLAPVKTLSFSPCGRFLAAICQDDQVETEKKFLVEVYDTEQRTSVAVPPQGVTTQTKTSLDWHPKELERPILAISGHNDQS